MDVRDYLKQPQKLDLQIRNKLIERQQYMDIALGITTSMEGSRVSSSGSKSKMSDAIDRLVDVESEIDALVDKLIDTKREIISTIEQVESPIEYNVLHLHYIQYLTIQEIADRYGLSYDWAKTTLNRGRESVRVIREETEGNFSTI